MSPASRGDVRTSAEAEEENLKGENNCLILNIRDLVEINQRSNQIVKLY